MIINLSVPVLTNMYEDSDDAHGGDDHDHAHDVHDMTDV